MTAITPTYAHAYQSRCLTGRRFVVSHLKFRLSGTKGRYPNLPNSNRNKRKSNDLQGWAIYTDGKTHISEGETSAGWCAVARSPHSMFGPVITTEAHLAYAGARIHSNITAELSSITEAHSFLGPHCPVTRDNKLLLQIQLMLRFTMQHIYSHAQNLRNEFADHAAALGTFGQVSNQNIRTRWTHPSFHSNSLFVPCRNLGDFQQVLRNVRTAHLPAPKRLVRIILCSFLQRVCLWFVSVTVSVLLLVVGLLCLAQPMQTPLHSECLTLQWRHWTPLPPLPLLARPCSPFRTPMSTLAQSRSHMSMKPFWEESHFRATLRSIYNVTKLIFSIV